MKRFGHFVALILLLSTSASSVDIRIPVDEYRVTKLVTVTLSALGEVMDIEPTRVDNSLCRPYGVNPVYKSCRTQNGKRPVLIDGKHGYNRTVLVPSENEYFYTWGKNTEPVITMVIPNTPDKWCTRSIVISCLKDTKYHVYEPLNITVKVTTTDGKVRALSAVQQEVKFEYTHITGVGTLKYNLGGCWTAREVTIHLRQHNHIELKSIYSVSEVELYGTYNGSGTVTPYPSDVTLPTQETTSGASNTGTYELAPTTMDSDAMRKSIAVPVSLVVVALIIVAVVIAVICAIVLWSRKRRKQENHDYEDPERHIYMDTLHIQIPNRHLNNNNHHQNCLNRGSGEGNYMEVRMTNNPGYHPTCSLNPPLATSNLTYMKSQVRDYEDPIPTVKEPQYGRAVAVETHYKRALTDESHHEKPITHESDRQPSDRNEHCGQERASGGGYAYVLDSSNGWHMESVESALTEITDETSTSSCSYI